ncbi:hypothetical protein DL765_009233 [Monosporascus sp. GIB2]|nr:hypothetical protein DL765_009233 [Monosporascus sp. GIB2]
MSITEAPPRPTCELQNQQPGSGITTRGCICHLPDKPNEERTLPLLPNKAATVDSQSCDYSTWPASTVENPITIETETVTFRERCEQCVKPAGNAQGAYLGEEECEPISGCWVLTVKLADTNVIVGDIVGEDDGASLRNSLLSSLKEACPSEKTCSFQEFPTAEIDHSIVKNFQVVPAKLQMDIIQSNFENATARDLMFEAAVATWHQASANGDYCTFVSEEYKVNLQQSCDRKRSLPDREPDQDTRDVSLAGRDPPDPTNWRTCSKKHRMCSVSDHITVEYGLADETEKSEMVIEVKLTEDNSNDAVNKFFCGLVLAGLAASAAYAMPMLTLGAAAGGFPQGINLAAMCDADATAKDWFSLDDLWDQ